MRYYTVHLPRALNRGASAEGEAEASAGEALGGAVLVREGFNWLAFFFSIPWAIANGLCLTALAMAAALALIVGLPEILAPDWSIRAVLLIGYAVICGFGGNDWRRLGLAQAGWELVSVVAARDRTHAFLRFAHMLDEDDPQAARPGAPRPPQAAPPAGPRLDLGPNPGFWS